MTEHNPLIERYMQSFEAALQRHELPEWKEISADLRNHIAEALHYKPLDQVLEALGPAEVLARAYAVELRINPPADRPRSVVVRYLSVIGILAASSAASFIVVSALGSIAVGLFGSGLAVLIIGVVEALGVHLPGVQLAGVHPLFVVALGPILMLIGFLAGWALWIYVRALIGMLMRMLPRALQRLP
jgi:anti-sigma factor RsiW